MKGHRWTATALRRRQIAWCRDSESISPPSSSLHADRFTRSPPVPSSVVSPPAASLPLVGPTLAHSLATMFLVGNGVVPWVGFVGNSPFYHG